MGIFSQKSEYAPSQNPSSDFSSVPPVSPSAPPAPISNPLPTDQEVVGNPAAPIDSNQENTPSGEELIQTFVSNEPISGDEEKPKKGKKFLILGIAIFIFFIPVGSCLFGAYAIAYEKVELKDKKLQLGIANFVMDLPLTPKTPKFLITKSILEQGKITTNSFDVSLAIKTSQQPSILGTNEFNLLITGVSDYKNQNDIDTQLNVAWGKDLNFDFIKYGQMVYFKVNTIPTAILNMVGINTDKLKLLLSRWIAYDVSQKETEASKYLDQKAKDETQQTEDSLIESLNNIFDEKITESIKVILTQDDGRSVYQLKLEADDKLVDYLEDKIEKERQGSRNTLYVENKYASESKLSDQIKNLTIELFLDKDRYYLRKAALSFDIIPNQKISQALPSQVLGENSSSLDFLQSMMSLALVAKFDDFGEPAGIKVPSDFTTFEEFSRQFNQMLPELFSPIGLPPSGPGITNLSPSPPNF